VRVLHGVGLVLGLVLLLWCAGFAWFLGRIVGPSNAPIPVGSPVAGAVGDPMGGIVALTGGAGRVKMAFHLLLGGAAPRLLVSGVAADTSLADLARISGIPDALLAGRVRLGHSAATTHGNALEAAAWAEALHLDSLIVVTSFYHMPRALTEFRRALPDVRLVPVSVPPPAPMLDWRPSLWRVVAAEYTKWLATEAGLSGLVALWERGEKA
jgi:uncharacterized SAM-binding protein YcdF (DUF218 family)